jgi:hypothetical protein
MNPALVAESFLLTFSHTLGTGYSGMITGFSLGNASSVA